MSNKLTLEITNVVLENFLDYVEEYFEFSDPNELNKADIVLRQGIIKYIEELKKSYMISLKDEVKEDSET